MATLLWDQLRLDEFWLAALPPSREGTSWLNILKTLVGYQLISPGSDPSDLSPARNPNRSPYFHCVSGLLSAGHAQTAAEDAGAGIDGEGRARKTRRHADDRCRTAHDGRSGGRLVPLYRAGEGSVAPASAYRLLHTKHRRGYSIATRITLFEMAVWPFDGWDIPAGRSAIAEVYPALWSRCFANESRTGDQHDAYSIVAWLSPADPGWQPRGVPT